MATRTQAQGAELLALLDEAPTGFWVLREGRVVYATRACGEWLACRCTAFGVVERLPDGACATWCEQVRQAAAECERTGSAVVRIEPPFAGSGASALEVTLRSARLDGEALVVGSVRELTRDERSVPQVGWLARHDALTGLPNRALLLERANMLIRSSRQHRQPFALLMVDLDGFKAVNDGAGHAAGDRVLTLAAQRFLDAVREADTVARLGGDEFSVLMPGTETVAGAALVAERLFGALDQPILIGERNFRIGCSIGIALFPEDGATAENLLLHADAAMYAAKRAGGGRYFNHGEPAVAALLQSRPLAQPAPRWSEETLLGEPELDSDHEQMLELLGQVIALTREGQRTFETMKEARDLLGRVAVDCERHFALEESLLRLDIVANGEAHRRAHQSYLANLNRLVNDFEAQVAGVVPMVDSLVDHIMTMDRGSLASLSSSGAGGLTAN
jgi:diguanylate cyclase (GGDEF)-like protein/hemerythrin-like metal-binding protein